MFVAGAEEERWIVDGLDGTEGRFRVQCVMNDER